MDTTHDELKLIYTPLSKVALWDENPKGHDIDLLIQSIARYGFKDPPKFEPELNGLAEGNGRTEALLRMHSEGMPVPRGIAEREGEWFIPVLFGVDAASNQEAAAYAVDHNNIVLAGGSFEYLDTVRLWDADAYLQLLDGIVQSGYSPVSVSAGDWDYLQASLMQHDTSFLNGVRDEEEDAEDGDGSEDEEDGEGFHKEQFSQNNPYVELSFVSTVAQRDEVTAVLSGIRDRQGLDTALDALLFLCRRYVDEAKKDA